MRIPSNVVFIKSQTVQAPSWGDKIVLMCGDRQHIFSPSEGKITVKDSPIYLVPQKQRSSDREVAQKGYFQWVKCLRVKVLVCCWMKRLLEQVDFSGFFLYFEKQLYFQAVGKQHMQYAFEHFSWGLGAFDWYFCHETYIMQKHSCKTSLQL